MGIPMAGGRMGELLGLYRDAWQAAGHPGRGCVMLAFHMFCHQDAEAAVAIARDPLNRYLKSLAEGTSSDDYPGYDRIIAGLAEETFESQVAKRSAWVGTPQDLIEQINEYHQAVGGFEIASLQVNFNDIGVAEAEASMRLPLPSRGGS